MTKTEYLALIGKMRKQYPLGLSPKHPDYDPDDFSYRDGPPKKDPGTPQSRPTRFYDGFDGFTYPGAPPARNTHLDL